MGKDWIQSLEGRELYQRNLTVEAVGSIEEIAHSLAGEFRFTRQTRRRYSVAQHCEMGSRQLPAPFDAAFLLHELSEVYLPDVSGPLKPFVKVDMDDDTQVAWTELERRHTHTILEKLKLLYLEPLIYSPEVKRMDLAMLAAEKRDLCAKEPRPWGLPVPATALPIVPWSSDFAAAAFLRRFESLGLAR